MKAIGRESVDAPDPGGFIAHLAGPKPGGGWRVVDLWESEDAAKCLLQLRAVPPRDGGCGECRDHDTPWLMHRVEVVQTVRHMG